MKQNQMFLNKQRFFLLFPLTQAHTQEMYDGRLIVQHKATNVYVIFPWMLMVQVLLITVSKEDMSRSVSASWLLKVEMKGLFDKKRRHQFISWRFIFSPLVSSNRKCMNVSGTNNKGCETRAFQRGTGLTNVSFKWQRRIAIRVSYSGEESFLFVM